MQRPHPPAFFAGLLCGLVLLSLAGYATRLVDQFPGVKRFHRWINPETLLYPTASQVVVHARNAGRPEQTTVIIGGSSVVFGSGQRSAELWSDVLQDLLGGDYAVVNLAFPSGSPGEHGSVAAQALLGEGRDVVYIAHAFPDLGGPLGNSYPYVIYDAAAHGYLLPSPERDAAMATAEGELALRADVDHVLGFSDLWQTVGVVAGTLSWQPIAAPDQPWWAPRRAFADPFPGVTPPDAPRYLPREEAPAEARMAQETKIWCDQQPGRWDAVRTTIAAQIPPGLRERAILVVTAQSPHFTRRLPAEQQACRNDHEREVVAHLIAFGYRAVLVGDDWSDDDFSDLVHPSGAGGKKLAAKIAPMIREIAGR